jgi:tetratricopeptide (TPR) repeat protein
MKSLFFLGKYDSEESPGEEDKDMLKFRAIGPATLAIKLKPDYKDAYITRGLISSDLGDFKAARDDFKYILEKIDPQDEQAKAELAKIENR